ncbi:MAG: hypothetical protein WBA23_25185 [Tunicatimonas sp.]|uniref:hypothetical protein n=1 Tax=Tunicatimonas sp. TaxID=1940096 RepID=UPI003C72B531
MKNYLVLTLIVLITACSEEKNGPVQVRITNSSNIVFDEAYLYSASGDKSFGTLAPGDTSTYQVSNSSNGYPVLFLEIGSDTIPSICILMDKLPPPPLPEGFYTFEVTLIDFGGGTLHDIRLIE